MTDSAFGPYLKRANNLSDVASPVASIDNISKVATDIAVSGTTANIGAATGDYVRVNGGSSIASLGIANIGIRRVTRFAGQILVYSSVLQTLNAGADIITNTGDHAEWVSLGGGTWQMLSYNAWDGYALNDDAGTGGGGGITTLTPVGTVPNANAANITGTALNLQPANASFPGVVNVTAQTFAGDKTFNGFVATQTYLWIPPTASLTVGVIRQGTFPLIHTGGSDTNFFAGTNAGVSAGSGISLTGTSNVGIGTGSAKELTTGSSNTFVGRQSGNLITTGSRNTGVGNVTQSGGSTGNDNTAIGFSTMSGVNGSFNTVFGSSSAGGLTTGSYNIAIGYAAYLPSGTADGGMSIGNIIYGFANTGTTLTPSTGRIVIGNNIDDGVTKLQVAGSVMVTQSFDLPQSTSATVGVVRINGTPVLHCAPNGLSNNIFVGQQAGNFTLTGSRNTALGVGAGMGLSSGSNNVLVGYTAGAAIQGGSNNVALGYTALNVNISGTDNVALGTSALGSCISNFNIGIGRSAGFNLNGAGTQNVAIGYSVNFPSATASGQLVIQNIIYGFANTGTGNTPSTGRISIGAFTDDGASKLQVYGNTLVAGLTTYDGTLGGSDTRIIFQGGAGAPTKQATFNFSASGDAMGIFTLQRRLANAFEATLFSIKLTDGAWVHNGNGTISGNVAVTGTGTFSGNVGIGTAVTANALEVGNVARFASAATTVAATTGKGVEVFYNGTQDLGYVLSFDRSGVVYKPLQLACSTLQFAPGGVVNVTITSTLATFGNNVNVSIPGVASYLDFGQQTRQMINLWGGVANSGYGIGVQSSTQYYRTGGGYAWFLLGTHNDAANNPGAGGTLLMRMDGAGNLVITGNVTAANLSGTNTGDASGGGGGVTTMTNIGTAANAQGATISGANLTLQPASNSFGGVVSATTQTFAGAKTFSGVLTANSNATVNGVLTAKYNFPGYYDNGNFGTTGTISWGNGNFQAVGLNSNCTFSFGSPGPMCMLYLDVFAGASVTINWPSSVRGSPPTSITAGRNLVASFLWDGGSYYYYMGGANNVLLEAKGRARKRAKLRRAIARRLKKKSGRL